MIWLAIINPITLLIVYMIYAHTYLRQNDSKWFKVAYWVTVIVGAPIDMLVNLTWATIIFLDWPHELLLTKRTERLKSASGYRGYLANLLCKLLNYFLQGHCHG